MTDIAAIVTVHNETVMAGPTMRSAELAIRRAEEAGLTVERLIGFDTPTDACVAYFSNDIFNGWSKHKFEFRDQGQLRNAMVHHADAKWIAFLDGDDLWSENWLVEAAGLLVQPGNDKAVAHPELNWIFERQAAVLVQTGQDDPGFLPHYFYFANYYDALCMAPRAAHIDFPYADRALAQGFAYEDWQWNIETMAAGWRHLVAPDTIIFKRRRENSQTMEAGRKSAAIRPQEAMRIDKIATLAGTHTGKAR